LTFANDTQRVVVVHETGWCGALGPSNGRFTAVPSSRWLDRLRLYTARR
jgi:hypothetical protein